LAATSWPARAAQAISSFAHASHCRQVASNCAFASSRVGARPSVRMSRGLPRMPWSAGGASPRHYHPDAQAPAYEQLPCLLGLCARLIGRFVRRLGDPPQGCRSSACGPSSVGTSIRRRRWPDKSGLLEVVMTDNRARNGTLGAILGALIAVTFAVFLLNGLVTGIGGARGTWPARHGVVSTT